jgi:hypothetical protein
MASARLRAHRAVLECPRARPVTRRRPCCSTGLSKFDESTRELRVHTTTGTISPPFLGLRAPPGKGLASSVAETRSPRWTSSHASMTQAPHDETIDDFVTMGWYRCSVCRCSPVKK